MNAPAEPIDPSTHGPEPVDATPDPPASPDANDPSEQAPLDLDVVERDLAGVEVALRRLDDGSYWTDEITGEPIPVEVLAADPVARRAR